MADMLLLLISVPIKFFNNSDEVSIAILLIFSGAFFLSSSISFSAFLISLSICFSKISLLEFISLRAFSFVSLKIFFASDLQFKIISSYS